MKYAIQMYVNNWKAKKIRYKTLYKKFTNPINFNKLI